MGLNLCADCLSQVPHTLRRRPSGELLSSLWALGPYSGPLGSLVRRAKYRPDRRLTLQLGQRLALAAYDLPIFDVITHVPVPRMRQLRRGFDQAELLALQLSRELQVEHQCLLTRTDSSEQAGRRGGARTAGSSLRFGLRKKNTQRVLLVDDQITSGGTLIGCAISLYEGGAQSVVGISLACSERQTAIIKGGGGQWT